MNRKRTGVLDHPTLNDLKHLIEIPEGSPGFNVEAVLLQQLYGLCLVHGYGKVLHMVEGIYEKWNETPPPPLIVRLSEDGENIV